MRFLKVKKYFKIFKYLFIYELWIDKLWVIR